MIFVFPFIKNPSSRCLPSSCCVCVLLGPWVVLSGEQATVGAARQQGGQPGCEASWGSSAARCQPHLSPFSWRLHSLECSRAGASPVAFCDSLEAGLPKPDLGLGEDGFE